VRDPERYLRITSLSKLHPVKMARTKSTSASASETVAATPAASAPVSTKKPTASVAAVPPVAATPAAAPAATPVADAGAAGDAAAVVIANPCEELGTKLAGLVTALKEIQGLVKTLSKDYDKMKKTVEKSERKRANARSNPNGFAKPSKIVNELCDFCSVPHGTLMSRTDVTRTINAYIKEKNLNKPENKRQIIPDEKLRTLLKLKPGEEINYFKLQGVLSPLFVK